MLNVLIVEAAKLRRSLVLLLCAAAPGCVAALSLMILLERDKPIAWAMHLMGASAVWAYFMLPMTITALTVLVAQLEHGPRAWNYLLALPVARWRIFLAKALVVTGLTAAMSAVLFALLYAVGAAAEAIRPGDWLTGDPKPRSTAELLARMFAGSLLVTAIQLWAALRFRSFVPPLVLGIGGTFVAVAATAAKQGAFFPWLIPVNALATDPARGSLAIQLGFFGGLAVFALMLAHLSRREAP